MATKPTITPEILRAEVVCTMLSISIPTLYRWQREGNFPRSIKYGGRMSGWRKETIDSWISAQEKASQVATAWMAEQEAAPQPDIK